MSTKIDHRQRDPMNEAAAIRLARARQTSEFQKIRTATIDRAVAAVTAAVDPVDFLRSSGGWSALLGKLLGEELEREMPGTEDATWSSPSGWVASALRYDLPAMRKEAQMAAAGTCRCGG